MKFLINNNTTYNYSYYATRPKWLVEASIKDTLSQKGLKANSLYLKKFAPIYKIAFAYQKPNGKRNTKKIKTNLKKAYQYLFQTKELLCWTSDLSFFNLRGYFSNILKILQICRFAVRNNKKILFIKGSNSSYSQGKLLNPWLVQYERNTVPQRLGSLFNESYLNPTQCLLSPQVFNLKKNKNKNQKRKNLNKIDAALAPWPPAVLTDRRGKDLQTERVRAQNTTENRQSDQTLSCYKRYYQLSGLLSSCLNKNSEKNDGYKISHFNSNSPLVFSPQLKNKETAQKPCNPTKQPTLKNDFSAAFFDGKAKAKVKSDQKKTLSLLDPYPKKALDQNRKKESLKGQNYKSEEQNLKNNSKYLLPKKVKIKVNNIIKLWIKEAQTMSQQTAAGLTIPLAGFLTNSKTAFNTVSNLSNYDFYNSTNSNLKPNGFLNKGICKINTNRLEKVHFQKKSHLAPPLVFDLFLPHRLKTTGQGKGGLSLFNRTPVYPTTALKGKSKHFIKCKNSIVAQKEPKDATRHQRPKKTGFLRQKGWWVDYSNNHCYLPLTPNTWGGFFSKDNESVIYNEKAKKQTFLEYCFFGDIFTWQSKSQKSSSVFYSNEPFNKNKDSSITNLKKQIILEKRGPIVLKKEKKAPFFKHFKRQLQMFKNLKFKLKGPFSLSHLHKLEREGTKSYFLKKKQLLSTLAKFIVFYLKDRNVLLKTETKQTKKNQAYVDLPPFSAIKTKVKLALGFTSTYKYNYKPIYGYHFALHIAHPAIFNVRDKTQKDQKGKKMFKDNPLINKLEKLPNSLLPSTFFGVKTKAKLGQGSPQKRQKKQRLRTLLFYRYYKTIIALNHLNQYKMFAKTPFVSNQLGDILFFINPEKNQNLVNQANCLKIPTVGIISGNMANSQSHQGYNNFRLKESVYYPILGNPMSSFFTRAIISLIVKFLRVEKSKNKLSQQL